MREYDWKTNGEKNSKKDICFINSFKFTFSFYRYRTVRSPPFLRPRLHDLRLRSEIRCLVRDSPHRYTTAGTRALREELTTGDGVRGVANIERSVYSVINRRPLSGLRSSPRIMHVYCVRTKHTVKITAGEGKKIVLEKNVRDDVMRNQKTVVENTFGARWIRPKTDASKSLAEEWSTWWGRGKEMWKKTKRVTVKCALCTHIIISRCSCVGFW